MGSLVQFVCFTTSLPQDEFLQAWEPYASAFLSRGIDRVVLNENLERAQESAFDFISRNVWDERRFERAFPHGVRGSGGLGPIGVLQAGAFRLADASNTDVAGVARSEAKVIVFLMTRPNQRERARQAARSVLQQNGVVASAIFLKDGDARTDRFDMVVEAYCRDGTTDDLLNTLQGAVASFVTAAPVIAGAYREVAEIGVEAKR